MGGGRVSARRGARASGALWCLAALAAAAEAPPSSGGACTRAGRARRGGSRRLVSRAQKIGFPGGKSATCAQSRKQPGFDHRSALFTTQTHAARAARPKPRIGATSLLQSAREKRLPRRSMRLVVLLAATAPAASFKLLWSRSGAEKRRLSAGRHLEGHLHAIDAAVCAQAVYQTWKDQKDGKATRRP